MPKCRDNYKRKKKINRRAKMRKKRAFHEINLAIDKRQGLFPRPIPLEFSKIYEGAIPHARINPKAIHLS